MLIKRMFSCSLLTSIAQLITSFSLVKLSSLFKVSFIIGSTWGLFSGINIAMPLVGYFGGLWLVLLTGLLSLGLRASTSTLSFRALAYFVPGMFAGAYLSSQNIIIRLFVPMICMILFCIHPVGSQAFVYSFYWLIPIGLYFAQASTVALAKVDRFYLHALGSTLTAHAVGSVIWLYTSIWLETTPMTPEMWLGLIPVVFVERILFTAGIVVVQKAVVSAVLLGRSNVRKTEGVSLASTPSGHPE